MELCAMLEDAIDNYNETVCEDERIYWWDVLNEINDLTDDEEVMQVILDIESRTKKQKAVIYTRGHSKEKQEDICRQYAEENGFEVITVSTEGESFFCGLAEADVLIVTDMSRISRNYQQALFILDELKRHGVELHIARDTVKPIEIPKPSVTVEQRLKQSIERWEKDKEQAKADEDKLTMHICEMFLEELKQIER